MLQSSLLAWFYWDPPLEAFTLPFVNHPVVWYGILFVAGFVLAYFMINPIFVRFLTQYPPSSYAKLEQIFGKEKISPKQMAYVLTDRLCWFVMIGTIVGARLGAVFFYDWPYFRENPLEIFKIWHGGLASHGGTLGVLITLYLYTLYIQRWVPHLTFLRLLDCAAVPTALVACFIRLGNFMNQEILGTPTTMPWGVVFGHPADRSPPMPRHPVQLYEASAYLISFFVLWYLWKKQKKNEQPGFLVGLLFILIFSSRFILEFWKSTQSSMLNLPFLEIGQILSIPFIFLGILLFYRSKKASVKYDQDALPP